MRPSTCFASALCAAFLLSTVPAQVPSPDPLRTQKQSLQQALLACSTYAIGNNTQFPPILEALVPNHLPDHTHLEFVSPKDGTKSPWIYFAGSKSVRFADYIVMASPLLDGKKRLVARRGHQIEVISQADFELQRKKDDKRYPD